MKEIKKKEKKIDLVEKIKEKTFETINSYIQNKITTSKDEILDYITKKIEKKVKKEIRNLKQKIILYIFLAIGITFILYGSLELILFLLNVPSTFTNLIFGVLIIIIGFLIMQIF